MYVSPMGRDVIFYLYPSDFTAGNTTDMTATMVTAASGTDAQTNTGGQTSATPAPTAAAEATPTPEATETPTAHSGSHRRGNSDADAGRTVEQPAEFHHGSGGARRGQRRGGHAE